MRYPSLYCRQTKPQYSPSENQRPKASMGDKSVETLSNKIEFLTILVTFSPFPPKQCWFFYFFDCTDHSAYTTLNWGAGGIRELTLEANKIEQMRKYRKASFPKSVSTTFVAHCCSVPRVLPGFSIIGSNWLLHMAVLSCTVIGRVDLVVSWLRSQWIPEYST